MLGGLLLASAEVPGHRHEARAADRDGIHVIRHVVVIMQENRSFDSYFGTYPGADGIPGLAGHPGTAVWTVRECSAPHHWLLDGVATNGNRGTITYTLRQHDDGTAFERALSVVWLQTELPEQALEGIRRQIEAESTEALRRLKVLLEEEADDGA